MENGVRATTDKFYQQGKIHGVMCLGGAEGAVLGAYAMRALPVGVPKVLVTPIASVRRHYGQLMGTKYIFVVHSVIDILGINPISRAVFDNADDQYTPGLYARLKLVGSAAYPGLLIKDEAVGTDLGKKFVLVVDQDNKAVYRSATTSSRSGCR